jgi:hypothetical protein
VQPPLIGREREIAALVATLETAGAGGGQGQALLFAGEPGIGKTRLLDVAAGEARARGMDVAWGTAWSGAPAYWPLVQALRGLGLDEAAARLWEPGRVPVDAGDHRFRLAAAVADALRSRRPTLILLDDLHDADRATLELVGLAIRASRGARVAWIGAYRRGEALAGGVGEALAAIAREGTALSVPPLDETQVASLARARGRGDAERLYRRSLGNPLFVLELLEWPGGDDLPDTVREVIAQRQARLEPDARAALEAAAILGGELSLAALAGVLGVTVEAAASMARRASRLGFMIDEGGVRLRFGHPLFREAVQAGLPPDRRRALHAAAAQTLEALRANGVEIAAGEIAHHYAEAELAPQTIVWALRGADEESRRGAHDRAATLCERALAACDLGAVAPARRIDALIALAEARVRGGDRGRGREVALRAAELARAGRDGERLARAALAHAAEFEIGAVDPRQVALLEEARAALPADSPLAARVLARLAAAMVPAIDSEVPLRLAREALASARRSLSEADRLEVMLAAGSTFAYAEPREKIALGEETAALALALGERGAALRVHARLVLDNLEGGEPAAAETWLERHGALLAELPLPAHQGIGKLLLAATAAMRGRFSEAFAASDGAFTIARELGDPSLFRSWGIQRFALLAAAGPTRS